jgi:uncharacterized protein YoxC
MNEDFNTGWDPHQELLTCVHNIGQLVLAVQNGSEIMKQLANKHNHQQEVIEQLMFQNRKLTETLTNQRITVELLQRQVQELKEKTQ